MMAVKEVIDGLLNSHEAKVVHKQAVEVSNLQLCILTIIPVLVIIGSYFLQLGVEWQLTIAGIRCFVQLSALGLILVPIIRRNTPLLVISYIGLMVCVAAIEAASRPPYVFPSLPIVCFQAIGLTVIVISTFIFMFVLDTGLEAQYAIPLVGMILGSSMSAVSVAISNMVNSFVDGKENVQLLIALGATRWEATWDVVRSSMIIGMTPALNFMAVSGLVAIPGMMTGQIIGGTPPSLAAKYQIIIIYAASGAATVSTLTSTLLTVMALVDEQYRIRSEKLAPRNSVNRLEAAANAFRYILSCFSWRSRVAQSLTPFLNQHPNSVEADSPRQGQTERTRYGSA